METAYSIERLLQQIEEGASFKYIYFWGHEPTPGETGKSCLSQWFVAPFTVDGHTYQTAEQWMMAQKALLFGDEDIYRQIMAAGHPGAAKDLGRQVKNFDEAVWNAHRISIVVEGNRHKFGQNEALRRYLLQTGSRVLVEASPIDRIWGIGLAENDPACARPEQWKGLNLLGFALMEVREALGGSEK